LKSEIPFPPIPESEASPNQVTNLARILFTWMTKDPKPNISTAKKYGHVLGRQILHACLDVAITAESLYDLVRDVAEFFVHYCDELEAEAGKSSNQKRDENEGWRVGGDGKARGMGEYLRMVVEEKERKEMKLPSWGRMITDAKLLWGLLQGASEEIGKVMNEAKRTGI